MLSQASTSSSSALPDPPNLAEVARKLEICIFYSICAFQGKAFWILGQCLRLSIRFASGCEISETFIGHIEGSIARAWYGAMGIILGLLVRK